MANRKIHLRANKMNTTEIAYSACASRHSGNGKVRANNRKTYQFMASEIVGYDDFKNVPTIDRCAHCMDAGLIIRNRQRKAKGLTPVTHLFEVIQKQEA